jgi:phosphate-selective porin OprO/OprP
MNRGSIRSGRWAPAIAIAFGLAMGHRAAAQSAPSREKTKSIYDDIWKYTRWYHNDDNPVLQNLAFSGRFQLDYAHVDADEGNHGEWNIRRFRLGAKALLFKKLTIHGEVDLNPQENDPFYVRLTDMYVSWAENDSLVAIVGKHSAPFTMDGATSSKELIAVDRSNVTNNLWFTQEYFPGASLEGERGAFRYHAGLYSSGSANREFGNFDGSVFGLVVVGYDFAKRLGVKEAALEGNYLHQGADEDNTFTRKFGNIASLNFKLQAGRWGLRTDLAAGDGHLGQSDVYGFMVMPFYDFGSGFQLVGRYTFVQSDDVNGVRLGTYENRVVTGNGDEYNELYLGLNYYFYGHKLKLQTGVQFADMEDRANDGGAYSGVGFTSGLRVSW